MYLKTLHFGPNLNVVLKLPTDNLVKHLLVEACICSSQTQTSLGAVEVAWTLEANCINIKP